MESTISHYRILKPLGAGGMGEVYLAEDTRLDRKVAIKFVRSALEEHAEIRKRLIREAKAAAKLDHPNICSIYEVGEENGQTFIVMQFVEGETLSHRIKRQRLTIHESVSFGVQIANALAEAHLQHIIHRDIKPQNIMITSRDQAKVMDFGLAKDTRGSTTDNQTQAQTESLVTTDGAVLGTVPYMSPEQLKGERLDARSDIFSFGTLLYEMLCGKRPFAAETSHATASAILTQNPPSLSFHSPAVPAELERIVRKCLEKDRERRFQTMRDVVIDLENLSRETQAQTPQKSSLPFPRPYRLVMLLLVLSAIVLTGLLMLRNRAATTKLQIQSIAVLPLDDLSATPGEEYFADGMTDALINNLAQIRALRVISRTSVMRYKQSDKSLPEIANELDVDAVIEGSVQRSGGRIRVLAKLIEAKTDAPLWAREYEYDLTDVLKLQAEIARSLAEEIRIQVSPAERSRLTAAAQVHPQAHEAYLLARYHFRKGNEDGWRTAIQYFEQAIKFMPDYSQAYAGLSSAWLRIGVFGARLREAVPPGRAAATKAISLNPQLAEGYQALGTIQLYYDWDYPAAENNFRRAVELDPGQLDAHVDYGHFLMIMGRHDEAVREGQIAAKLDPVSPETQTSLGRFLYRARRYEEALPYLKRAVELQPQGIGPNFRLGDLYVQLGRYEEALAAFEFGKKMTGGSFAEGTFAAGTARVYAVTGRRAKAEELLQEVKEDYLRAVVFAALGDKDRAFELLEKSIEDRNSIVVVMKEDPPLESLHSDPRWNALLQRMNFRAN